jgi:hypothetical protein
MINIVIPNNNINERRYILSIIFDEFLGLSFNITESINCQDWIITLQNKKTITIKDTFFNKYPNDLSYLNFDNIPNKIEDLDIFSASFFMLTRWEEYVNKNRDNHDRFPAYESLAFKQGFLDKPVVNEYIEKLKDNLLRIDPSLQFKQHKYQIYLTHDVDTPLKYNSLKGRMREIIGDIVKRKNLLLAIKNILSQVKVFLSLKKDPFNTFDYLMDTSDMLGVKSYFFFMGKGSSNLDENYNLKSNFIRNLVKRIESRGHFVGMHSTYNSHNNPTQFKNEKMELTRDIGSNISFGRGHYLRFEVPTTWQVWEDGDMEWDSTLSYADRSGFRCGVCYKFSVFNILTRKKLNLKERPLIVMDDSFATYQHDITPSAMKDAIVSLRKEVEKYNGEFVFLWHNNSFNTIKWKKYQDVYRGVLGLD